MNEDYEVCILVEAACCISSNGKGYNVDKDFSGWVRDYIKRKITIKQC